MRQTKKDTGWTPERERLWRRAYGIRKRIEQAERWIRVDLKLGAEEADKRADALEGIDDPEIAMERLKARRLAAFYRAGLAKVEAMKKKLRDTEAQLAALGPARPAKVGTPLAFAFDNVRVARNRLKLAERGDRLMKKKSPAGWNPHAYASCMRKYDAAFRAASARFARAVDRVIRMLPRSAAND